MTSTTELAINITIALICLLIVIGAGRFIYLIMKDVFKPGHDSKSSDE